MVRARRFPSQAWRIVAVASEYSRSRQACSVSCVRWKPTYDQCSKPVNPPLVANFELRAMKALQSTAMEEAASDRGVADLKGFDEPMRLFEVRWRAEGSPEETSE
jgi:hypothetical protein